MQSRARSSYAEPQPSLAMHLSDALQRYEKYQCETILSPDYFQKVSNVKKYTKRTFCVNRPTIVKLVKLTHTKSSRTHFLNFTNFEGKISKSDLALHRDIPLGAAISKPT